MILKLDKLCAGYEASQVLFDMDLTVSEGECVALLGRNGMGKTTTVNSVMGLTRHISGSIIFKDCDIARTPTYVINRKGISLVIQERGIFPNLTVRENLLIAGGRKKGGKWPLERLYELFPALKKRDGNLGAALSGGEQQMLAIARGLIQDPELLVMDEITEGLAPIVVSELAGVCRELTSNGVSILLAEQNARFALGVSDRCYILEKGRIVHEDRSENYTNEILNQYLRV